MKNRDFLTEARRMTAAQLSGKIQESKKHLIELDQDRLLGKIKNTAEFRVLRHQVAQLMTLRDEKISEEIRNTNA